VNGPLLIVAGGAAAACAVVLFMVGLRMARTTTADLLDVDDLVLLRKRQRHRAAGDGIVNRLAQTQVPRLRRTLGPRLVASLQKRIDEAGRPDGLTVDGLLQQCAWWALLVVVPALLFLVQRQWLFIPLCAAVPIALPLARLATAQRKRQERMERDLPDFLDVLSVTVMAGVTFRAALARVADRFTGPLADEVTLTLHQISTGVSVRDAFSDMRKRTSSEPVAQFVSALLQSQELGAPLAESLNQIAADIRKDSAQRQRQAAAKVSPRISIVSSLVLLPATLILVLVGFVLGVDIDWSALRGILG
jgi:tight adherence protein C